MVEATGTEPDEGVRAGALGKAGTRLKMVLIGGWENMDKHRHPTPRVTRTGGTVAETDVTSAWPRHS